MRGTENALPLKPTSMRKNPGAIGKDTEKGSLKSLKARRMPL